LTENWKLYIFFETNESGQVLRLLVVYEKEQRLKYTLDFEGQIFRTFQISVGLERV
jgi:hypothetical protein